MRNSAKILICLFFCILLSGCGNVAPASAATATTPAEIADIQTIAVATFRAQITQTITAVRSPTPTTNAYLTRMAKITLPAIALATLEPTQLPAMLQNALSVKTIETFNGHKLQRITGWQYGFTGFEWMDQNYLLIRPVVGFAYTNRLMVYQFNGRPVVMRFNQNTFWFPPSGYETIKSTNFDRHLSGISITHEETSSSDTIHTYNLDGDLLKTYQGKLLGISPSNSKILLAGTASDQNGAEIKWIDLLNNKEVMFDWQQFPGSEFHPIWSPDEMSVYIINPFNYNYGNAKTGESYVVAYADRPIDGDDSDHLIPAPRHSYGTWVLNDTYLLARWNEYYEGTPGFLSFFDPAKKMYRNLSALIGFPYLSEVGVNPDPPYPCENGEPIASPGGRYVWVNCLDSGHLIDMKTFKSKTFLYYTEEASLEWSADGNFAFLHYSNEDPSPQLLSAIDSKLTPISTKPLCYSWHPKQSSFIYMDNKESLSIFDTHSMSIQRTVTLPINFDCPVWNKPGNKLMMRGEDDSLWQIDYPALSHLEQLTKPIKDLKGFESSPDGRLIVFPVGMDIYIVDTNSKP